MLCVDYLSFVGNLCIGLNAIEVALRRWLVDSNLFKTLIAGKGDGLGITLGLTLTLRKSGLGIVNTFTGTLERDCARGSIWNGGYTLTEVFGS